MRYARGRVRRPTHSAVLHPVTKDCRRRPGPCGVNTLSARTVRAYIDSSPALQAPPCTEGSLPAGVDLIRLRHELRTPLSGLLGLADLLSTQILPGQSQTWLATLQACGQQLASLIDRSLRPEMAGPTPAAARGTDGIALLESLLLAHWPAARQAGTQLALEFHPSAQGWWKLDGIAMRQALDNLLSNAIRFSRGGRVTLEAYVLPACGAQPSLLQLAVEDSGPGLLGTAQNWPVANLREGQEHDEYANRVYPMSSRGLGLRVVEEFCRNHSGQLQRGSTDSGGTRMVICLPATMVIS
jgi:signal transduction histidine kinase